VKKIVITGPESTGKSVLTMQLEKHFHALYIPEYARDYVMGLDRPYTYEDIEHIAETQIWQLMQYKKKATDFLFLDTFLIITKIWFQVRFNQYPVWIDHHIKYSKIDLYLLCDTDLPWFPDKVREHGGQMRENLFNRYKEQLKDFGLDYAIVRGTDNVRFDNALSIIQEKFNTKNNWFGNI